MKIKELHLRNIASIERADIDFEHDLCDAITGEPARIFLIAGETGTGKSVLLDGISMALYNKTPRTEGVENKTNNEYSDEEGNVISVKSIEQYTRLGISEKDECYSEVVFEGNDDLIYRARLSLGFTRTRPDANGKTTLRHRTTKWEVKVGDEDWKNVAKKTGEPILSAVGLTFEQFGRMAMLAQGQFAAFLTGNKTEREEILEQLTNTRIFSRYGEAIKNIFSGAKTDFDNADKLRNAEKEHILAPEETARLSEERSLLTEEKGLLDKQFNDVSSRQQLVRDIAANKHDVAEAEQRKAAIEAVIAGEEYKQKASLVADWDATTDQRELLKSLDIARRNQDKARTELDSAKETFTALTADKMARDTDITRREASIKEADTWLDERSQLDELYAKAEAVCVQLTQFYDQDKDLSAKDKSLKEAMKQTATLQDTCARKEALATEAKTAVGEKQAAIDDLSTKRNALNPTEINSAIQECNKKALHLNDLRTKVDNLDKALQEAHALATTITDDEATLNDKQAILEEKNEAYRKAQAADKEATNLFTTMETSLDEKLINLRQKMREEHTQTCPLCGQHIHAILIDDEFDDLLAPLKERQEAAKAALSQADTERTAAQTAFATLRGKISTNKTSLAEREKKNEEDGRDIRHLAAQLSLDPDAPLMPQVETAGTENESRFAELKSKQKEAESLQEKINALDQEKKPLEIAKEKADQAFREALNAVTDNQNTIRILNEAITNLNENKKALRETLSPLLDRPFPTWQADDIRASLKADANAYNGRKAQTDNERRALASDKALIITLTGIADQITASHGDWAAATVPVRYSTTDIVGEWATLQGKTKTQDALMAGYATTIREATAQLQAYYTASGKTEQTLLDLIGRAADIEAARRFVQRQNTDLKSRTDAIETARQKIALSMEKLGAATDEDIPALTALNEQMTAIDNQRQEVSGKIGGIDTRFEEDKKNRQRYQEACIRYEEAKAKFDKWSRINQFFGGARFRTLVQTYILQPLLSNANIYLRQITDRYILKCSEDNEQLAILVYDDYMKQTRSATILSGGERFMISLALSLALSSLNRPDMNVNILFIDEGFGTLDAKSLESVMTTLEKLQEIAGQSNRRVGIISHREELNRIPVKIIVKRKGEGRSIIDVNPPES